MECTLIKNTNWTLEIQYGRQMLVTSYWVSEYKYIDLTETEVQKIRDAKIQDIQRILTELY